VKRNSKDIVCKCGHNKKSHGKVGAPIWDEWCNGGRKQDRTIRDFIYICTCSEYVPDNLLHIEKEAKKRKLI